MSKSPEFDPREHARTLASLWGNSPLEGTSLYLRGKGDSLIEKGEVVPVSGILDRVQRILDGDSHLRGGMERCHKRTKNKIEKALKNGLGEDFARLRGETATSLKEVILCLADGVKENYDSVLEEVEQDGHREKSNFKEQKYRFENNHPKKIKTPPPEPEKKSPVFINNKT